MTNTTRCRETAAIRAPPATPARPASIALRRVKEPLGPAVPLGDDQWFNVVKWTVYTTFQAEESGVTSKNVNDMLNSKDPTIRRLLDVEGDLNKGLGLDKGWVGKVIQAVGNYGEIYDRNLTPLGLPRGPNQPWTKGGLLYSPPYR